MRRARSINSHYLIGPASAKWLCGASARKTRASGRFSGAQLQGPRNANGLIHLAQGTNVDIEGPGEILRITSLPTPGERRLTLASMACCERRISVGTKALHHHPDGMASWVGRTNIRRRTGRSLDPADPGYPQAEAGSCDLLHRGRKRADRTRAAGAHDPRRARGRKSHLHAPEHRHDQQDPNPVRAERNTAPVSGLHRAHSEALPRALFR